jgi:hypothetical protein
VAVNFGDHTFRSEEIFALPVLVRERLLFDFEESRNVARLGGTDNRFH